MSRIAFAFQLLFVLLFLLFCSVGAGQTVYRVDSARLILKFWRYHLDLGGTNTPAENHFQQLLHMEENGTPRLPVMGEFHYARFQKRIGMNRCEMKAGGVNVVATYVLEYA